MLRAMANGAAGGALALLPHCTASRQDRYLLLHLSLLPAPSVNARVVARAISSRNNGTVTSPEGIPAGPDEQQQGAGALPRDSSGGGACGVGGEGRSGGGDAMLPVEDMLQLARSVDRERIDGMLQAIGKDASSQVRG